MQKAEEIITSRQNALVMLTVSLTERRNREREGLFRFDGRKLFLEALAAEVPLFAVLLRASAAAEYAAVLASSPAVDGPRVAVLADTLFDRISEEKSPEGVICVAKRLDKFHKIITIDKNNAEKPPLAAGRTLVLESVRDPGNLGTAIRSAAAFGIGNLVLTADCADLYHPRTIRAAMGTLFRLPVLLTRDLPALIPHLRERGRVYAAALDAGAHRLGEFAFGNEDTVVVGNEGHGISPEVLSACGDRVFIPMAAGVESLNAGVAASVLLWEMCRE